MTERRFTAKVTEGAGRWQQTEGIVVVPHLALQRAELPLGVAPGIARLEVLEYQLGGPLGSRTKRLTHLFPHCRERVWVRSPGARGSWFPGSAVLPLLAWCGCGGCLGSRFAHTLHWWPRLSSFHREVRPRHPRLLPKRILQGSQLTQEENWIQRGVDRR